MTAALLLARVWVLGCWLASQRLRLLAVDPTPVPRWHRVPNDRVRLCGR